MKSLDTIAKTEITIGPDEQIYRAYRRHWADLLGYVGMGLLFILPPIIAVIYMNNLVEPDPAMLAAMWLMLGMYFCLVASFLFMEWLFWYFDVWIVTSERLIDIELINLFKKQVSELHIAQIQDVRAEQSGLLATFFNFGNVICQTAGVSSFFALRSIPRPEEASGLILDLHESYIEGNKGQTPNLQEHRSPHKGLPEILIAQGYLGHEDWEYFRKAHSHLAPSQLGKSLMTEGYITSRQLLEAIGIQHNLPMISLADYDLEGETVQMLDEETAKNLNVIPVSRSPHSVTVAIADPSILAKAEFLRSRLGMPIAFVLADPDIIKEKLYIHYSENGTEF